MKWILPPSVKFPAMSGQDMLVARVQDISLDQRTADVSGSRNSCEGTAVSAQSFAASN